ncbi:MAG: class I SAM-dependent methyltransferase [Sideroxydans sp.]|jgi:SAM-dependent methyltransferase
MKSDEHDLGTLIMGMRDAYMRGENAMAWARNNSNREGKNEIVSTLVAYDLQAGSYVADARANPNFRSKWCAQLAGLIRPYVEPGDRVLEVGVGEATTLAGVIKAINQPELAALGFDVSWSRIKVGQDWVKENSINARLFVGDLFHIPLADNSIDVIYTSHSLEPNGGKESEAIAELFRVARKAVVLVEPLYELATEQAQNRMRAHGYVMGLKEVAEKMDASIVEYGLLEVCGNPLNPSGVVLMQKPNPVARIDLSAGGWQCPLTGMQLVDQGDIFYAEQVGLAYPVMRGIPLLRGQHGVVASKVEDGNPA